MLKIGHRGAKGHRLENTLPSFQKALELGVDGIELDVHLSNDGVVVVLHDATVDRTTTQHGPVKDFTAAQLQLLGIPSLEQVLAMIPASVFVNIEIKAIEATLPVLALIEKQMTARAVTYEHFHISSFDWEVLRILKNRNPNILLGVLTEDDLEKALAFAERIDAHSINPYFQLLTVEQVTLIHQKGFKVYTWTVNSPEDITFVRNLNVDGSISDFPDRL